MLNLQNKQQKLRRYNSQKCQVFRVEEEKKIGQANETKNEGMCCKRHRNHEIACVNITFVYCYCNSGVW